MFVRCKIQFYMSHRRNLPKLVVTALAVVAFFFPKKDMNSLAKRRMQRTTVQRYRELKNKASFWKERLLHAGIESQAKSVSKKMEAEENLNSVLRAAELENSRTLSDVATEADYIKAQLEKTTEENARERFEHNRPQMEMERTVIIASRENWGETEAEIELLEQRVKDLKVSQKVELERIGHRPEKTMLEHKTIRVAIGGIFLVGEYAINSETISLLDNVQVYNAHFISILLVFALWLSTDLLARGWAHGLKKLKAGSACTVCMLLFLIVGTRILAAEEDEDSLLFLLNIPALGLMVLLSWYNHSRSRYFIVTDKIDLACKRLAFIKIDLKRRKELYESQLVELRNRYEARAITEALDLEKENRENFQRLESTIALGGRYMIHLREAAEGFKEELRAVFNRDQEGNQDSSNTNYAI